MSVRSSLLAILTIGPAYGFQLHNELRARTAARRTVNVGQIYGTLERLVAQGAVESAGTTEDGLPLYQLTRSGRTEAVGWLHETRSAVGEEWNDLLDRVLIASSLPGFDALDTIGRYRRHWETPAAIDRPETSATRSGQEQLAEAAARTLSIAALAWLDEAEGRLASGQPGHFNRDFSPERPRRGRRPAAAR